MVPFAFCCENARRSLLCTARLRGGRRFCGGLQLLALSLLSTQRLARVQQLSMAIHRDTFDQQLSAADTRH